MRMAKNYTHFDDDDALAQRSNHWFMAVALAAAAGP